MQLGQELLRRREALVTILGQRHGDHRLQRRGELDEAAEHFRWAAKAKAKKWSTAARVSLGLILFRQGKNQQAVFELRRVAGTKSANLVAAQAWGMLVIIHRQTGKAQDAERAQGEYRKMLEKLIASPKLGESAMAHFMLGMDYKFDGDRASAKEHLQTALASDALPDDERQQAENALKSV